MTAPRALPIFAALAWYSDPRDHRCPHDAWLESIEIREPAEGDRQEKRRTEITVRLLGAYHDGHIVFRYSDVGKYSLANSSASRGAGDWLHDEFSFTEDGKIAHHITWCEGPSGESQWLIEAGDVSYEWIPKKM